MRRCITLVCISGFLWALPSARAEQPLQTQYLNIYLKINDAEHLEKQGDFRGSLDDFKDCYEKLNKIHQTDPNWETALVVHRMEDCRIKILELEPKAAAQPAAAAPTAPAVPAPPTTLPPAENPPAATVPAPTPAADTDEVSNLKLQLQAVKEDLRITKEKLQDSEAQLEAYRSQLQTVNSQLAALKAQPSTDERMAKLTADNKSLTEKLATAQKEIDDFKLNPKSKLALAEAQLKNLQEQYDASQEANKALQATTTSLKQQLDQAQADLVAANQKLATATAGTPEYETLKRENEVMRDILRRELQEQAHRDMAKRLAQEEFDNLKLKSKVLQEQLDILSSPMTPPTNDQERALLASLKVPGPDVAQQGNGFSAQIPSNPPATAPDPNAPATPPATATAAAPANTPPATDGGTNQPPVNIVMNNPATTEPNTPSATPPANNAPSTPNTTSTPATTTPLPQTATTPAADNSTNTVATTSTPPSASAPAATPDSSAPAVTNTTAASAPIPPNGQPPAASNTAATPPPPPSGPTKSTIPPAQTTVTDTTITQSGGDDSKQPDPTQYSTKARLPEDMRDTAQEAVDLFKNGKYDESAAKYQAIIDKYPESLYAWSNLGVVRFQQQKYDEALKALQQAVKLSPTDAFSYSNLGIVYYQLGQYENAIDALNSAKALDPNDAKTHNYLGCACSQKGWSEVAEREFRKAIEIDPNFGDAHFNLALVLATAKPPQLEMARREYNRALELGIAKDQRLEKLLNGAMATTTP